MIKTQAFVNIGRWIVDCGRPDCHNAERVEFRQSETVCTECGAHLGIEWPTNAEDIAMALLLRPVAATQNWAPRGHRQAVQTGFPDGQTVEELMFETLEHGVL